MSRSSNTRVRRSGAYIIKSAEAWPPSLSPKQDGKIREATTQDRKLADALLKRRTK